MHHLLVEPQDKKTRYLEMNRRLEIHDVLVTKFLKDTQGINGFCKGIADMERKARFMVERNEVVSIGIEDLDEATILKDLLDTRFKIEQVMSHAFQIPTKDRAIDYRYNPSMTNLRSVTDKMPSTTFSMTPGTEFSNQPTTFNEANKAIPSSMSQASNNMNRDASMEEEKRSSQASQDPNKFLNFDTQFHDTIIGDGFLPIEQTPATPHTPATNIPTQRTTQNDQEIEIIE